MQTETVSLIAHMAPVSQWHECVDHWPMINRWICASSRTAQQPKGFRSPVRDTPAPHRPSRRVPPHAGRRGRGDRNRGRGMCREAMGRPHRGRSPIGEEQPERLLHERASSPSCVRRRHLVPRPLGEGGLHLLLPHPLLGHPHLRADTPRRFCSRVRRRGIVIPVAQTPRVAYYAGLTGQHPLVFQHLLRRHHVDYSFTLLSDQGGMGITKRMSAQKRTRTEAARQARL